MTYFCFAPPRSCFTLTLGVSSLYQQYFVGSFSWKRKFKVGLVLFCPITSKTKGYPFEVALPDGLPIEGFVLAGSNKNFGLAGTKSALYLSRATELLKEVLETLFSLLPE